MTAKQG